MTINMADIFRETVAKQPDHPALVGPRHEETLSYAQLSEKIDALADSLKGAGIRPGDCIGLHLRSGREYIIASYAIWSCGACVVPIPVELKPNEKEEITSTICISHVVSHTPFKKLVDHFQLSEEIPLENDTVVFPMASLKRHPVGFHEVNAAFIRFSSGTTGTSKGVVLSHESVRDRIHAANQSLAVVPEDRIIWLLSMSYHFTVSIVSYLSFGATVVLPENYFAQGILQAVQNHEGTFIYGSPIHYHALAKDRSDIMLPHVRLAVSTTTGLTAEVGEAFIERFGIALTQAYGIIEVGLPCINLRCASSSCETVGHVLAAYEVDLESTEENAEFGEIKIRGKGLLDAYYEPWQPRSEIMDDGWFRTGDLGQFDDKDCLCIKGRSKEMICVSGMKLFPQEVEAALNAVPGVKESAVFAHPHPRFGEVPHAHVVLQNGWAEGVTEEQLRNICQQRLAVFKVPEKIFLVDALRLTASGKILRRSPDLATQAT